MSKPLLIIGNRNYSSWSMRGWLLLTKGGVAFDELMIPLFVDGHAANIAMYSPAGKVPIYQEGPLVIWDTLAIAEYIAEKAPMLWPDHASDRAHARAVSAEMHAGFSAIRSAMPLNCRAKDRRVAIDDALRREIQRVQQIIGGCRLANAQLGPWLFGRFTIADAMYVPVISRFATYGVPDGSEVGDYMATVMRDPDVLQWYDRARADVEIIEFAEVGLQQ